MNSEVATARLTELALLRMALSANRMTVWEAAFVRGVSKMADGGHMISDKQAAVLRKISASESIRRECAVF